MSEEREYLVPMRFTISGEAYVTAPSLEEALTKAHAGQWDAHDVSCGETISWKVTGDPELNE